MKLDRESEKIVKKAGEVFERAGESLFLVGGSVRDMLSGDIPRDLDFSTSAKQEKIRKIMAPLSSATYDKSRAKGFGTTGVVLKNGVEIEITPFRRSEGAPGDGPPTLEEDLRSRDFTINAVAVNACPAGYMDVSDPCGGVLDFGNSKLATPIDPFKTFEDDPLRILRAARFAAAFNLKPAAELVAAIIHIARDTDWPARVAAERVREEIVKMLLQPVPSVGMRLMKDWGLMKIWLPEVDALADMVPEPGVSHKEIFEHTMMMLDRAAEYGPADAAFRFAALMHDTGKPLARTLVDGVYSFPEHELRGAELAQKACERLRWSNEETERVAGLVEKHHRLHGYSADWTDSAVRRALHSLGERYMDVVALARSDITSSQPEKVAGRLAMADHFEERVKALDIQSALNPRLPITGIDVMELLGIPPGPDVGRVISYLKDKVVSGELDPSDEAAAREITLSRVWTENVR